MKDWKLCVVYIAVLVFCSTGLAADTIPAEPDGSTSTDLDTGAIGIVAAPEDQNGPHNYFAATLNGEVWQLLEKADRSPAENERMVYAAHASCYHWLHAGTGVNHQRGEWLIARVYTVLGRKDAAIRHAERCLELTETHKEEMKDFDWAYAHEALARAHALAGNRDAAFKHRHLAEKFGNLIAEEEDKKIFMSDFSGGEWYGVK